MQRLRDLIVSYDQKFLIVDFLVFFAECKDEPKRPNNSVDLLFCFYFQSKVELMKSQRKQLEADLRKQVSLAQFVRI